MEENIITLISRLSCAIIGNDTKNDLRASKCLQSQKKKKLCKKAFDVFHRFDVNNTRHPCEDSSGNIWSPHIILSDYCYELQRNNAEKAGEILWENIETLQKIEDIDFGDIFTFLLCLKRPFDESKFTYSHPLSLSGIDYFFKSRNPFSLVPFHIKLPPKDKENKLLLTITAKSELFLDSFIDKKNINQNDISVVKNKQNPFKLDNFLLENTPISVVKESKLPEKEKCVPSPEVAYNPPIIEKVPKNSIIIEKNPWTVLYKSITNGEAVPVEDCSLKKKPFIKRYEESLEDCEIGLVRRKSRKTVPSKSHVLNVYLRDRKLLNLLDPSITCEMRPTSLETYVTQVKYLLCGINSNLFEYDVRSGRFSMKVGLCLPNVSPDTLFEFSKEFLEIGSCFLKLKEASEEGLRCDHVTHGTLYQIMWQSVSCYLHRHTDKVAEIPTNIGFLELKESVQDLHSTITSVTKLCVKEGGIGTGGTLLSYLFDACVAARHKQLQQVLLSFLFDCTSVYLSKMVQTWIYEGVLDRVWSLDFFVYLDCDVSKVTDRSYYLGISSIDDHIPNFLRVISDRIISCGKAVHLLAQFNPENKFTHYLNSKRYPKIKFCWSEEELSSYSAVCQSYETEITQLCGEAITYRTIREKETIDEQERDTKMREVQLKVTPIKPKNSILELKRKKQEEQSQILKAQIEEAAKRKKKIKEDDKLEDQRIAREIEKIREEEEQVVELEKIRLREYYKELEETAQHVQQKQEWRTKRALLNDERTQLLRDDFKETAHQILAKGGQRNEDLLGEDFEEKALHIQQQEEWMTKREQLNEERTNLLREDIMNEKNILDEEGNIISEENANFVGQIIPGTSLEEKGPVDVGEQNVVTDCEGNVIGSEHDSNENLIELETDAISTENNVALKIHVENQKEALRNKLKVFGSEYSFLQNPAEPVFDKRIKDLNNKSECKVVETDKKAKEIILISANNISPASEKNKTKVLNCEYNLISFDSPTNINIPPTEAMRNKIKVLGSEYNILSMENSTTCKQTDPFKNKIKVLGSEEDILDQTEGPNKTSRPSTEAEKNKKKILGSEYDILDHRPTAQSPKVSRPLTEAEKNKMRVLSTEYNVPITQTTNQVQKTAMTPAQRNKKRMLSTELGFYYEVPSTKLETKCESHKEEPIHLSPDEDILPAVVKTSKQFFTKQTFEFQDSCFLPSLDHLFDNKEETHDISQLNIEEFSRLLLKSVTIALNTQERLSNAAVLKHFFIDEKYASHVFSLKAYFLLYDGEFSRSLTQSLFESLDKCTKPQQFFERNCLCSIVDDALQYTIHHSENAQNLSFQIVEMPKVLDLEAHNVLNPFQLSYKVQWPLNLMLTDSTITRYRKIFHVLLSLKRVHWTLNETFHHLKIEAKNKKLDRRRLFNSPHYIKLSVYRHAMTLFIMTLEEHTSEVGPREAWSTFINDLDSAATMDQLYYCHIRYVKDVLRRCFLVKGCNDLLSYINELISIGLKFHYTLKSSTWYLVDEKHYEHPKMFSLMNLFNKFCDISSVFTKTLRKKVQHPDMKVHLPLVLLIDMKMRV